MNQNRTRAAFAVITLTALLTAGCGGSAFDFDDPFVDFRHLLSKKLDQHAWMSA